ncbi:ventral expressed homeobox [Cheilinus undulatus]|uniref:ventral expressed homeobox n=1 Tax=Cheilinus undulatus TaxID=241271 RepID=UPI001BD3560F|nr:ventral expressed homeobox [Cheilinus undulatus]
MANFSVEWLSRSCYENTQDDLCRLRVHEGSGQVTSMNDSCGYTSGSESEVGEDSEGETTQQRRMRTKFTSEQIRKLEETFGRNKYLGAAQRRTIAERLNLSETQVKTWFQNRRMKLKREVQDLRPQFLPVPAALLPPLLFQHHPLSGQLLTGSGLHLQLQPLHRTSLPASLHQHSSPRVFIPPHYH